MYFPFSSFIFKVSKWIQKVSFLFQKYLLLNTKNQENFPLCWQSILKYHWRSKYYCIMRRRKYQSYKIIGKYSLNLALGTLWELIFQRISSDHLELNRWRGCQQECWMELYSGLFVLCFLSWSVRITQWMMQTKILILIGFTINLNKY